MSENTAAPAPEKKEEGNKTVLRAVTFGGFNRADVLDFIEKQKKVEADLRKQVEDLNARLETAGADLPQTDEALQEALKTEKEKAAALEREVAELREKAEAAVPVAEGAEGEKLGELSAALESAKQELESVKQELEQAKLESEIAAQEKDELDRKVAEKDALLAQYAAKIAETDALLGGKNAEIAKKDAAIADLTEKLAAAAPSVTPEEQIGAVLLDARRCADDIIATAKMEESRIRAQAYTGILKTQKTVQAICDELTLSFERYKRNAELARSVMDELNAAIDEKVRGFSAPSGEEGASVE